MWAAAAVLLLPSAVAVWISSGLVTDVPWGDHLTLFRDTRILEGVTLESLFRFHNEHLIVPTRLTVAADYWLWHGVNLLPAVAALLLTLGIIAIEAWMFRRAAPGLGEAEASCVTATIAAVLLNGRLTWTLTFPVLMQHVSANFFVIATLAAFAMLAAGTARSRPAAAATCLSAAGLAAISSASGVFALPAAAAATIVLAAVSPAVRRGPWRPAASMASAIGVVIVVAYAVAHAAATTVGNRPPPDLLQAMRFAIYFPGGAWFRDGTWPIVHHPDPLLLHAVVLGFWMVVAGLAWRLWRKRDTVGEFELFHAAVLTFILITAGIGGLFRADLGGLEAINKKYAPTALLAWATVVSIGLREVAARLVGPGARGMGALAGAALLAAAILPGDMVEYRAWRTWHGQLHKAAAAYAAGARDEAVLLHFFPDAREAESLLQPIAADAGYCFRSPLAAKMAALPVAAASPPAQRLDRVPDHKDYAIEFINEYREPLGRPPAVISATEAVELRGWAVDRDASQKAAGVEVVVAGQRFRARSGVARPDVAEHFSEPGFAASGFQCLLPAGTLPRGPSELVLRILLAEGETFLETPAYRVVVE